jgi:hypothetical protein
MAVFFALIATLFVVVLIVGNSEAIRVTILLVPSAVLLVGVSGVGRFGLGSELTGLGDGTSSDTEASTMAVASASPPLVIDAIGALSEGHSVGISSLLVASAILLVSVGRVGRFGLGSEFTGLGDGTSSDTESSTVAIATLRAVGLHNFRNVAITSTTEGKAIRISTLGVASAVLLVSVSRVG